VVVSHIYDFRPHLGKIPILTSIFFKWVGEKPPTRDVPIVTTPFVFKTTAAQGQDFRARLSQVVGSRESPTEVGESVRRLAPPM